MNRLQILKSALIGGASVITLANPAAAKVFNIPNGDLAAALGAYMQQAGVEIVYSDAVVRGHRTQGARGNFTETSALTRILAGTGFTTKATANAIGIVPETPKQKPEELRVAQARGRVAPALAPAQTAVETVVVTAQHKSENIQNVPIAVTALSQAQLTERQIAGGPDLVKEVPNLTFSKTNFSGYNLEIRGIGTQAISVTTDPAVAVAFNGTPFIRNHFFEQEFYDVQDVEVLRGPQGTLYGRNATAGVVNVKSALPDDQYEGMLSADIGNYSNRRLEGMINLPFTDDRVDLRLAGEWTKRDGYSFNELTNSSIDGRDLWSTRATLGIKPSENLQIYLVWEHFQEDDNRLRSGKQLCKTAPDPVTVDGVPVSGHSVTAEADNPEYYLTQGCEATSLYSSDAFEVPNGKALSYASAIGILDNVIPQDFNPYASTTQSQNLRVIESAINPTYRAKNDTLELNADYAITPALTFTSQTGYNHDFLWSSEDYNRFDTAPGIFMYIPNEPGWQTGTLSPDPHGLGHCQDDEGCATGIPFGSPCDPNTVRACILDGVFCDPQLGCSDRLVAEDLSEEHSWQLNQEFRLTSNFSGPLNFSAGANFLHYETEENYYVFINTLTHYATAQSEGGGSAQPFQIAQWVPGVSDNSQCLRGGPINVNAFARHDPTNGSCIYIDPNPITSLDNEGHNYFLSQNPYLLNSYATFGEAYYNIASDLKLIAGARWTNDQKHFIDIPSELLVPGYGYPVTAIVDQQWSQWTGRFAANWTPKLDFTDQTLIYGSYSHGYKAGGANPPGATLLTYAQDGDIGNPIHPLTFKPEFVEAFELGSKNTLLDNALTLDGDIFYYNYTGYQISRIVDRTAINDNFNAHVEGAELESNWEPLPGLKFNFTGGYENAVAAGGDESVDLMDRTAGNPNWIVVRPFITQASNCILPTYVVATMLNMDVTTGGTDDLLASSCGRAYNLHDDPVTWLPYIANPSASAYQGRVPAGYIGYDPTTAPNNGQGFDKNLGGNQLPNAPHFTTSLSAEYTIPVSEDWAATFHTDFYWQSQQWARIFDDRPYDKLRGYSNLNLALILTSANGWQVMGYVKNVFDVTAITGDFLNSDDSGLTTNVFLTDPRLFGVRVTKQLDQNDGFWGSDWSGYNLFEDIFGDSDNARPPLWIELGGQLSELQAGQQAFSPTLMDGRPSIFSPSQPFEHSPRFSTDEEGKVSFQADNSDWIFSASVRYGRSSSNQHAHQQTTPKTWVAYQNYYGRRYKISAVPDAARFADTVAHNSEQHSILDFQAGKDVGLGIFGEDIESILGLGVRFAQFASKTNIALASDPDFHFHYKYNPALLNYGFTSTKRAEGQAYHSNSASLRARRKFQGVGPAISWAGSAPYEGNPQDGQISVDWGLNISILFGRQKARVHHQTTGRYRNWTYTTGSRPIVYQNPNEDHVRARNVAVPNIGGTLGLSWQVRNCKLSFGYRADEFFGAMDGGIDTYKSENRGFFGPYANISIGLGG